MNFNVSCNEFFVPELGEGWGAGGELGVSVSERWSALGRERIQPSAWLSKLGMLSARRLGGEEGGVL
jgi:hypothetical protein